MVLIYTCRFPFIFGVLGISDIPNWYIVGDDKMRQALQRFCLILSSPISVICGYSMNESLSGQKYMLNLGTNICLKTLIIICDNGAHLFWGWVISQISTLLGMKRWDKPSRGVMEVYAKSRNKYMSKNCNHYKWKWCKFKPMICKHENRFV